jgi:hypothetical protein
LAFAFNGHCGPMGVKRNSADAFAGRDTHERPGQF